MRACFFGDSFVNGTGDDSGLGWVGRIVAHARQRGADITAYNLGVRRETSEDIEARWLAEARPRFPPGFPHRLLFSFGANDCTPSGGGPRVPPGQAIAAASRILGRAAQMAPTIVVGPIPVLDDPTTDRRIAELGAAQERLCRELGIPFFAVQSFLESCAPWRREAAAGDGSHPNSEGYAALARFLLERQALHAWLGIS
jgi:acyl-CoA thioesterase-1